MLQSEAEITAVLHGTPLQGREVVRMESPGPGYEAVLAVDVQGLDLFQAWQVLREKVGQTGRWPVLFNYPRGIADVFPVQWDGEEHFSRFEFSQEDAGGRGGDTPADILAAAQKEDPNSVLADLATSYELAEATSGLTLEDIILMEQRVTQHLWGAAPEIVDIEGFIAEHGLTQRTDIDAWFLRWELEHCAAALDVPENGLAHQEWSEDGYGRNVLLLMPFVEGEATLAYLHWYAAARCNSQSLVALLRSWREKYGAELAAHEGTTLRFVVARPPTTLAQACELARQHQLAAPCTLELPGISLRNHARALLHTDRWLLHEDP